MLKHISSAFHAFLGAYITPVGFFIVGVFLIVMSRLIGNPLASAHLLAGGIFLFGFALISVLWILFLLCLDFATPTTPSSMMSRTLAPKAVRRRTVRRK